MFIGASPGSTSGGLKSNNNSMLTSYFKAILQGKRKYCFMSSSRFTYFEAWWKVLVQLRSSYGIVHFNCTY